LPAAFISICIETVLKNVDLVCGIHDDFSILWLVRHERGEKFGGAGISVDIAPAVEVRFHCFDILQYLFCFSCEIFRQQVEFIKAFPLKIFIFAPSCLKTRRS